MIVDPASPLSVWAAQARIRRLARAPTMTVLRKSLRVRDIAMMQNSSSA